MAVAGLLIHRAADREVASFGRQDLLQTADRLAISAGLGYAEANAWTVREIRRLIAPEVAEDHVIVLLDENGGELLGSARRIPRNSSGPQSSSTASASARSSSATPAAASCRSVAARLAGAWRSS